MSSSPRTADRTTKTKEYNSQEEVSDNDEQEQQKALSPPRQKRRAKPTRKREQSRAMDMLPRNKASMNPAGQIPGNSAAGNAVNQGGGGDKKSDTLRLRLELNLDIEITLKARIHGDLTLSLLN